SNGDALAKSLAAGSSVAGDLLINSSATLNAAGFALAVQGNWTNNGAFIPSTGTVSLNGRGKNLSGATTFNNLGASGSYGVPSDITVNGTLQNTGTIAAGPVSCTLAGDFLNSGAVTSSGMITFTGAGPQTLVLNSGFNSSGTVNFNGSIAPTLLSISTP